MPDRLMLALGLIKKELELLRLQQKISREVSPHGQQLNIVEIVVILTAM